jgi:hypothetical protein
MSLARAVFRELVDKRLWPLAVLLVVAIVAIPVLLGGGSSAAPSAASLAAPPEATGAASPVQLLGPPSVRRRAGNVVDPFRRPPKPAVKTGTTGTSSGGGGDTGGGGGAPSDAGASSGGAAAPDPGPGPRPTKPNASHTVYRTTVRWSTDGAAKPRRIARLTPFGGVRDPAVLYLGVDAQGAHALFLLGPYTSSDGEAKCREATCRVIALKSGDKQLVDLASPGAKSVRFELELVSIHRVTMKTVAATATARNREHPDGRDVLRKLFGDAAIASAMTGIGYDRAAGVMTQTASAPAKHGV